MGCGSSSAAGVGAIPDNLEVPEPYQTFLSNPPNQSQMNTVIETFRDKCDEDVINQAKFLAVVDDIGKKIPNTIFANKEIMTLLFHKIAGGDGQLSIRKFNLCCTFLMFDKSGGSEAKAISLFKSFVDDRTGNAVLSHRGLMDMLKEAVLAVFDMADQMLGKTGSFPGGSLGKKLAEGIDSTLGKMLLKSTAGHYLDQMDADDSGDITSEEFAKYAIGKGTLLKTFFDWFDRIGSIVRGDRSAVQEGKLDVKGGHTSCPDGTYWVRLDVTPGPDKEVLQFWKDSTQKPAPGTAPDHVISCQPQLKVWQMDQKRDMFAAAGLPGSPDLWMKIKFHDGQDIYLGADDDPTNDDWYDDICNIAEMEIPPETGRAVPDP
eukprot:TRINITY_DN2305_c0_g1_i3.p1 TRINITY_DN2305_c0_g1~~TRINITY_DN2305_c0_g1_i3.p1  ORF type:complete len:375 (+),score=146.96 TRINITY_DN2305_c0_g1_i3:465-1589(+)